MAETDQTAAGSQRTNTDDTVFRVNVLLDGGRRSGLPLATGYETNRSFDSRREAERLAEDIRENPMEYYGGELHAYDGSLKVTVEEDTRWNAEEAF